MKNSLILTWIFALIAPKVEAEILPKLLIDLVSFQSQYFPSFINLNEIYNEEDKVLLFKSALSFVQLAYISQFPTAATSFNISDQCKKDSQTYFHSYKEQKNWALKSI